MFLFLQEFKEAFVQQESAPAPGGEAPAEEAPFAPAITFANHSEPDAAPATATEEEAATPLPTARPVSAVDQQCCGGFRVKSKICVIQ